MQIKSLGLCLVLTLSGGAMPAAAQTAALDEPLSAIDWLSDVVRNVPNQQPARPQFKTKDIATSAAVSAITTTPLGRIKLDAVGLLPRASTGLPADFWSRSSAKDLAAQLAGLRTDLPPPLLQFLSKLLLAELPAPADSADGAELFLSRVDKFLELGALDQAQALIRRAGPTRPELFGRWFDISLLSNAEDPACRSMLQTPSIAPTYPARIFCLARAGDWDAAALTLGTAETLGVINPKDEALLARFLDPELFEGEPFLPVPDRITPLSFRMHEAIGEPLGLGGLPNAFAYADLSDTAGWKTRIAAAERLARTGAVRPEQLFALYTERSPAASGGIWDRVDAIQNFEAALNSGEPATISTTLPTAIRAMRSAGLEYAFGQAYGASLLKYPLTGDGAFEAVRAGLMSKEYEVTAQSKLPPDTPAIWRAVATDQFDGIRSADPLEAAIIAGFTATEPPATFDALLKQRRLGEAVLEAMELMADGPRADLADIEHGVALLKHLALNDVARQTALHMLLSRSRR